MISLAMIARNEQNRIGRCLRSAQGCVDEIIVVDTGSTDDTRRVAAEFGAQVLEYPFAGDFSAARNVSLSACKGDWILVLDADEFFPISPKFMLDTAVDPAIGDSPNSYKGYYLLRQNYEENDQSVTYSDYVLRLFKRGAGVEYRHRVHETVEESLDGVEGKYGKLTAVPVSHYLFERERAYLETKRDLYVNALLKDIEDNPEDAGRYDFLGCEYARVGKFDEAERAFRKFLELRPNDPGGMESLSLVLRLMGRETV